MDFDRYVHETPKTWTLAPASGQVEVSEIAPAVWTLAHRGHSGDRALDVWIYPNEEEAWEAGATFAMHALNGVEALMARDLMAAGRWPEVVALYEESMPEWALLRVQPSFLSGRDT